MVMYGQVVVGPPGSGKTTYCNGMQQYLRLIGRETVVVNLDPANEYHHPAQQQKDDNDNDNDNDEQGGEEEQNKDRTSHLPYDALLDASEDIINLSTVMEELNLGPNGGLIYCLEYIHHHMDTFTSILRSKIETYQQTHELTAPPYIIFDLPGQVELYTHSTTIQSIMSILIQSMDIRLVMVQLIDAHHCMDVHKFVSSALLSTTAMLRLELPAVNVLSKIDLLSTYAGTAPPMDGDESSETDNENLHEHEKMNHGEYNGMPFNLDFFMECQELDRLLPYLDAAASGHNNTNYEEQEILDNDIEYQKAKQRTMKNAFYRRHYKLHEELCDVINDFSLLSYIPLDINDAESVGRVVARVDKSNGYIFTGKVRQQQQQQQQGKGKSKQQKEAVNSSVEDMFQCAMQVDSEWGYEQIADVQERYMGLYQDNVPELKSHGFK